MIKKIRNILVYFIVLLNMVPAVYASQPTPVNHNNCSIIESSMDSMMNSFFTQQDIYIHKTQTHSENSGADCILSCDATSNRSNRVYNIISRTQTPVILISRLLPINEYLSLALIEVNSRLFKPPNESITLIDYQAIKFNC